MGHSLKLLGIHGLGDHRHSPWKRDWQDAIRSSVPGIEAANVTFEFFEYDEIFETLDITFADSIRAIYKLLSSGVRNWWKETPREGRFGLARSEGVFDAARDKLRWTAGYVVGWIENEAFRRDLRHKLIDKIAQVRPDVILGHSLGSLIAYDALISDEAYTNSSVREHLARQTTYVSLGSQIANPFVVGNLHAGRILPLPVQFWYHLYNAQDDVFTAPVSLPGVRNFRQVNSYFDIEGWMDHDAVEYFKHTATVQNVWVPLIQQATRTESLSLGPSLVRRRSAKSANDEYTEERLWRGDRQPQRKALLVGINDYPDPRSRLAGCINDVFLMSALLQEHGYQADDIRLVLNDRATAQGILSRLEWLVEDTLPGDQLLFYFSGHGAQLPAYNAEEIADHMDEALVPYDFDWTPERSVIDDQIYQLYSQLHYDTRLTMIFDCCHSGGIHRDGGPMVRGLAPPDDIRHRALQWDPSSQLWVPRAFAVEAVEERGHRSWWQETATHRLGRATTLRQPVVADKMKYDAVRETVARLDHEIVGERVAHAPYLPLILQACQEGEFAYEYRHGVESFGAFTYMLAKRLRARGPGADSSLTHILSDVGRDLATAGRNQHPQHLGPMPLPELF